MRQKTFIQAATACFLFGLLSAQSALRIGQNYLSLIPVSRRPIATILVLIYLIGLLIYIFTQMRKNSSDQARALFALAFWQGALRYIIAFDLCVFGIGKFFDIQFNIPLAWLATPFGNLEPHDLLFAFYGHFYALPRIIGVMQITGALMLLFRRTRLAGVIFLLPIILNLVLLNSFYLRGTLYYVVILAFGLTYLLMIDYYRLKKFFFLNEDDQPYYQFKNPRLKNALRVSAVVIPLLLMAVHPKHQFFAEINGEYSVENLTVNNEVKKLDSRKDSVLTKIFIDKDDFIFEYNSQKKRLMGSYNYDRRNKGLTAWWYYPRGKRDTLFAKILPGNKPETKIIEGQMGSETLRIELVKLSENQ